MRLTGCDWSALDRVVCSIFGVTHVDGMLAPVGRTVSVNTDGSNLVQLGQRDTGTQSWARDFDGNVIDWRNGVDGKILMSRTNIPEVGTGTHLGRSDEGLSVVLVDTRTGQTTSVERARQNVAQYVSDGRGAVRMMTLQQKTIEGRLKGVDLHFFRTVDDKEWRKLGQNDFANRGMKPLALDPNSNVAYVLQPLAGRQALYSIALDGSMKSTLVFASPEVDVDDVVRIGRNGRVIGVTWTTDRSNVQYVDPDYRDLAAALGRSLPELPLIRIMSASADEQILAIWAGSDVDPGHLYIFDRAHNTLTELFRSRPRLNGKTLSPVRAITYSAADGTQIPAYLTLPPGVTDAKDLPAIVMPHGGPASRDDWGFDWLAQYFSQRGFAVLQPNYRGSGGYGDQWYVNNGFKSWKTAVGDIRDGARWLVAQGMADPAKLAIFGWSYGGYAALQANVLAPDLFKAVVAVAPISDLAMLKAEAHDYTSGDVVDQFVGDGPHVTEGSPARSTSVFKAPVLMFHGDTDVNVDIEQSRLMDERLRRSGKSSELVVYPKLEHDLLDGTVRADMLRRSDAFLRRNLGM
jgi:dipeptidyl aminopeptidase/acylaminoacyl peptidase